MAKGVVKKGVEVVDKVLDLANVAEKALDMALDGAKVMGGMVHEMAVDAIEKNKALVKIPDLKDVHIDEACSKLQNEYDFFVSRIVAKPKPDYAIESENEVVYTMPKPGARVEPKTTIKVYYLTQEVIDESKKLVKEKGTEVKVPRIIGLNVLEAQEDLEAMGLKVTIKLESDSIKFADIEPNTTTRITYPDGKKIGAKLKNGERIFVYYVNEAVIIASKEMKAQKAKAAQDNLDKIAKTAKELPKEMLDGAAAAPKQVAKQIGKIILKKKSKKEDIKSKVKEEDIID